jgi:hypothetical protein
VLACTIEPWHASVLDLRRPRLPLNSNISLEWESWDVGWLIAVKLPFSSIRILILARVAGQFSPIKVI